MKVTRNPQEIPSDAAAQVVELYPGVTTLDTDTA